MNPRTIGFFSALPLLFYVQTALATANGSISEPAWNDKGVTRAQCGGNGAAECADGSKQAGDPAGAASPDASGSGASTPAGGSQAPVSPLQQCKIGCVPQCNAFGNADLAAQCRESCEAKCDATYGKK